MPRNYRWTSLMALSFLCLLLIMLTAMPAPAQTAPSSNTKPAPPIPSAPPATDQEEFLPYWTTETGWDTEIQLRNNQSGGPLTVTPVLRAPNGAETPLEPVSVNPQDVKIVDVVAAVVGTAPHLVGAYGLRGLALPSFRCR